VTQKNRKKILLWGSSAVNWKVFPENWKATSENQEASFPEGRRLFGGFHINVSEK